MARNCRYSCETAVQTLEWINAIIAFLRPHRFLCDAHVVNFFKDRLWESVDEQWMECLRVEPVENLLKIPSGMVQDYWPSSLKEFILVLRSLVLPQEQTALQMVCEMFPNLHVASLSSVLTQGMNLKKKHEVEILAAIVNSTARKVGGQTIIDVGAGQGYLAQVLSFQYHLSVVAIDASSHLGEVTSARAERIKKHYLSKMRKARTFLECREVKAVVSIGCCYNLLSEEGSENTGPQCGFPMSESAKLAGFSFGKNARDLACQSAERWRNLTRDAALQNFDLHAFRAVFQMVLCRYYPEVWKASPSIGRKGKALRRQQQRRVLESNLRLEEYGQSCSTSDIDSLSPKISSSNNMGEGSQSYTVDKCSLFENFCKSGLCRLGLVPSQEIDFLGVWKEAQHFSELVGPYWSLRAALGPLLETLILLDRLLFLQEQGNMVEATVVPIFDPRLSPRNVAIIAWKKDPDFIL
ncbi:protein RRNAD1 isoform X5 [Telopea speciosissima]|uniref:protein RRNAD1 isoform X5 n=1 Tax=Telopea speciosissima TaxID=54955 RepID=UPI001CC43E4C|nr:protein RRNAD1 isoform X5 [Telopea speciosissima]